MINNSAYAEQQVINYLSPQVDCDWLEVEYISATQKPHPDEPSVTREGLLMTGGMILTLPLHIFNSFFSKPQPKYDFSRDVNDIKIAAEIKQCNKLLYTIQADNFNNSNVNPIQPSNLQNNSSQE